MSVCVYSYPKKAGVAGFSSARERRIMRSRGFEDRSGRVCVDAMESFVD